MVRVKRMEWTGVDKGCVHTRWEVAVQVTVWSTGERYGVENATMQGDIDIALVSDDQIASLGIYFVKRVIASGVRRSYFVAGNAMPCVQQH